MTCVVAVSGFSSPFFNPVYERLVGDGYTVVGISDREVASTPEASAPLCDVRAISGLGEGVELCGLVLCDSYFQYLSNGWMAESLWSAHIEGILLRRVRVVNHVMPLLAVGAGVVFVTTAETERGSFGALPYVASHAAVHAMVRGLTNLLGRQLTIRVNAVAPGWIEGVLEDQRAADVARAQTPLQRLGKVAEVAAAVSFLVGPDASFVSGQVLVVDGGYLCGDPVSLMEYSAGAPDECQPSREDER